MNVKQLKKYNELSDVAKFHNGQVVSNSYVDTKTKMTFKCAAGHLWDVAPRNLLYAHCWCPICYKIEAGNRLAKISIEKSQNLLSLKSKMCKGCEKEKNILDFSQTTYKRNNKQFSTYGNKCHECKRKYLNKYRENYYTSSIEHFLIKKLEFARKNAKQHNKEFNLNLEYLLTLLVTQDGKCAISGLEMTADRNRITSMSIDRIDSNIGYVVGNIQIVCTIVNFMKRHYDMKDFVYICKIIALNYK